MKIERPRIIYGPRNQDREISNHPLYGGSSYSSMRVSPQSHSWRSYLLPHEYASPLILIMMVATCSLITRLILPPVAAPAPVGVSPPSESEAV